VVIPHASHAVIAEQPEAAVIGEPGRTGTVHRETIR